ncbi:MAG: uroporphyrinogen decarboxylase family protein [Planctomycetota bacterium]
MDRVPWAPIIFKETLSRYSPEEQEAGPIEFTKRIGADVLWRWGDFLKTSCDIACTDRQENGNRIREWRTPAGVLREVRRGSRIVEHRLKTRNDLAAFKSLIEATRYEPNPGRYEECMAQVGDAGIVAPHIGPTAVQRLVQMEAGVDGFAYLCADHPKEMGEVIERLHQSDLDRFRIAAETPAEVLIQVENTSTLLISPATYRQWSRRHVADFCRIAHARGKAAIVHMCGHVKDLLPDIAATGLDGVDCLTPPPTGNTTPWDAWAVMGPRLIVHGILDPTAWVHRSANEITAAMDRALPPGMKDKNFLLCTAADGLPDIPRDTWDVIAEAWRRFSGR